MEKEFKVGDRFIFIKEDYDIMDDKWVFEYYEEGVEYFIQATNWDIALPYQLCTKDREMYWISPYALKNSFKPVDYRTIKVF